MFKLFEGLGCGPRTELLHLVVIHIATMVSGIFVADTATDSRLMDLIYLLCIAIAYIKKCIVFTG